MGYKLWRSFVKELLLLQRDFGGLLIVFIMPLVLVVTVTLIQDSSYKSLADAKMPILFVDADGGSSAKTIISQIEQAGSFELVTELDQEKLTEEVASQAVFKGSYQMAIVLPAHLSQDLKLKIEQNVNQILSEFGLEEQQQNSPLEIETKQIKLYFDPATPMAFKEGIKNAIAKMIAQIENQSIYEAFQEQLGAENKASLFEADSFISFAEMLPENQGQEVLPNSVQHNVPAWTLFAIFFIIVPLSISIVKEKNQGTQIRLLSQPTPYAVLLAGKTAAYLLICLLQFYLILAVGMFVFPQIGLAAFEVQGKLSLLTLVALFSGLAAIGLGILLGTVAKTQEQSSPFGATFVVILAAIGGVWIPVFAMPTYMQYISRISPMNWALNGFYNVLLRNGSYIEIATEIILLFLFFALMLTIAIVYDKKKRAL